jgi:hypothetical protein
VAHALRASSFRLPVADDVVADDESQDATTRTQAATTTQRFRFTVPSGLGAAGAACRHEG